MKPFNTFYIQDWGSYNTDTIVVVGMTHEQIIRKMRKVVKERFVKAYDNIEKQHYQSAAFCWTWGGGSVMRFDTWKNNWYHWDTLVHETNHLIQMILVEDKGMKNEWEGLAYQQEFLFREIRQQLAKRLLAYKCHNDTKNPLTYSR